MVAELQQTMGVQAIILATGYVDKKGNFDADNVTLFVTFYFDAFWTCIISRAEPKPL